MTLVPNPLAELRREARLTQDQVAAAAGVAQPVVAGAESRPLLKPATLVRYVTAVDALARERRIALDALLERTRALLEQSTPTSPNEAPGL